MKPLAGFRWDPSRQRYFPANPALDSGGSSSARTSAVSPRWSSRRTLDTVLGTAQKDALVRQTQATQISLTDTSASSVIPSDAPVSAFQTLSHDGRVQSFAGNTLGWFYSSDDSDGWQPRFYLSSEVSCICVSGATCIATTFGPECRILHVPLDLPVEAIHRIDGRVVHDIWTADLLRLRLALGANKQAVLIDDISVCTSLRRLSTQSDVLSLAQDEHVLYTGLRNGGIVRFDTRLHNPSGHSLLSEPTSPITHLKRLRDHQLLASFMDGAISTFDLRFPIQTPVVAFAGNFNKYTVKLPLAVDPYERYLFAAGQDNKIRLWSLVTGGPDLGAASNGAFRRSFEHRIAALQVVEERDGLSLLAVSGTDLCKYRLGHRSGVCI